VYGWGGGWVWGGGGGGGVRWCDQGERENLTDLARD